MICRFLFYVVIIGESFLDHFYGKIIYFKLKNNTPYDSKLGKQYREIKTWGLMSFDLLIFCFGMIILITYNYSE